VEARYALLIMSGFFGHIDAAPLFYGLLLAIGVLSMLHKLLSLDWVALIVEAGVFYVVFSFHKGSMTGGMAAAICALIIGTVFRRFSRWVRR
jgi:hypothetical protein